MNLIKAEKLGISFDQKRVLQNVDFAIDEGEIVTIVGPNGSGKSTLLRLLVKALRPGEGSLTISKEARIGYVPQRLHLEPTMPLNVERFLNLSKVKNALSADAALEQVEALNLKAEQMNTLSGGQLQRVLLARALMRKPNLLILDEATQGLDQPGSAAFYKLIQRIKERTNAAVLMVSHELHVVMAASDRVICLNGHICCEGSPELVATAPEYRALFGSGTDGTLALYRHDHNHHHDHSH